MDSNWACDRRIISRQMARFSASPACIFRSEDGKSSHPECGRISRPAGHRWIQTGLVTGGSYRARWQDSPHRPPASSDRKMVKALTQSVVEFHAQPAIDGFKLGL